MSVYDIGQFNTATQELSRACSELEQLRSQPDAIVDAKKNSARRLPLWSVDSFRGLLPFGAGLLSIRS